MVSHNLPNVHPLIHHKPPVSKPVLKLSLHSGNTHVHLLKSFFDSLRSKPNAISSMNVLLIIDLYLLEFQNTLYRNAVFIKVIVTILTLVIYIYIKSLENRDYVLITSVLRNVPTAVHYNLLYIIFKLN